MIQRLLLFVLTACTVFAQDGAAIYSKRCATCHDAAGARIPPLSALRAMSVEKILRSFDNPAMKTLQIGTPDRYAVALYLAIPAPKVTAPPAAALCNATMKAPSNAAWNGWGADLANTRFQSASAAGLKIADVPKLKLKWAFGLGDSIVARAQPSVSGGR